MQATYSGNPQQIDQETFCNISVTLYRYVKGGTMKEILRKNRFRGEKYDDGDESREDK